MSEGKPTGESPERVQRYAGTSRVVDADGVSTVALEGDLERDPVSVDGKIKAAVPFREALSALYEIVRSDMSYKPKDRSAYLAYQQLKKQTAGQSDLNAQAAYFDWLYRNDPNAWFVLDPVVTAGPDGLTFEVFSKDEGVYGQLFVEWSAFDLAGPPSPGTTHIDFGEALYNGVQQMRSFRETRFTIGGAGEVGLETEGRDAVVEKRINVPDSWLRGFLQVQSAATLPAERFALSPMDFYNLLLQLRMNKDQKRKGRAVRAELVPGEHPRLILEPWEHVIETDAAPYTGRRAHISRIWGRRRLMLLRRFLPFVTDVAVHVMGSGLPSFYVLRAGPLTMTLGLTGFTAANWSGAVCFDVLLPRPGDIDGETEKVVAVLKAERRGSLDAIADRAKLKKEAAYRGLQRGCQMGLLMYDLAAEVYRFRPLVGTPLDPEALKYRGPRERLAHDLLAAKKAVSIVRENRVFGVGLELLGKAAVAAEKREYQPELLIDPEGRVKKAECTCGFFRQNKLKQGPCEHLLALRLLQAERAVMREKNRGEQRETVTVETRSFAKRHGKGEKVLQICLDNRRLKIRFGDRSDDRLRVQNLVFDTEAEAREAYFSRIDHSITQGYLDETTG